MTFITDQYPSAAPSLQSLIQYLRPLQLQLICLLLSQISSSFLNLPKPGGPLHVLPSTGWKGALQRDCGWVERETERSLRLGILPSLGAWKASGPGSAAAGVRTGCTAMPGTLAEPPVSRHHLRQLATELEFRSALPCPARLPKGEIICFKMKQYSSLSVVLNLFWGHLPL